MSYMNTHDSFAPTGTIIELTDSERDSVAGGVAPLVQVAWFGTVALVSFVAGCVNERRAVNNDQQDSN